MEIFNFSIDHGYIESVMRGLRISFLTPKQYQEICAFNNMQELVAVLLLVSI